MDPVALAAVHLQFHVCLVVAVVVAVRFHVWHVAAFGAAVRLAVTLGSFFAAIKHPKSTSYHTARRAQHMYLLTIDLRERSKLIAL